MSPPERIILEEYVPRLFNTEQLPDTVAEQIWRQYGTQIAVDFPSPKTAHRWQLTPKGWVGHIPLGGVGLTIQPKVPLENLFRMLEYAYGLESFFFLDGTIEYDSIEDVYQRLAHVLARRILTRTRRGLHRAYVGRTTDRSFLRERMDVAHHLRRPWDVHFRCHHHEHTPDVPDNQILAWTLFLVIRSGLCQGEALAASRQAFRQLQGAASLKPFQAEACVGRTYDRLNQDYEVLHALCRFFLEHTGPGLKTGDHTMLPFLVNMAGLFETFVAEWLKRHLPPHVRVRAHERHSVGDRTSFDMDLVLYEARQANASEVLCVLDTKYKLTDVPAASDVAQVVTYAVAKGCSEAVLIYPSPLSQPLDAMVGSVRVRSLSFSIGSDIERAGQHFLEMLGTGHPTPVSA